MLSPVSSPLTPSPVVVHHRPSFHAAYVELTHREFSFKRRFHHVVHGRPAMTPDVIFAHFLDIVIFVTVCISTMIFVVETLDDYYDPAGPQGFFFAMEALCVMVLTVDMMLRFASAISVEDIVNKQTLVDTLSIVGFYISLFTDSFGLGDNTLNAEALRVLRMMRLGRMIRLFKRTELGVGFTIVTRTMNIEMRKGLVMMVLLVIIAWVSLSTLFFNVENSANTWDAAQQLWIQPDGNPTPFQTIPACFWFVSLTMATVGYGDVYPVSRQGRLMAFVIMCCGVLFLALPTMIVGATFETLHRGGNQAKMQRRLGRFFRKVRCCVRLINVWRELRRTGSSRLLHACITTAIDEAVLPALHSNTAKDLYSIKNTPYSRPIVGDVNFLMAVRQVSAEAGGSRKVTMKALQSWNRRGISAYDFMMRVLVVYSGVCSTREFHATLRTHPSHRVSADALRRRDIGYLAYNLAEAGLLDVYILSLAEDDLLVAVNRRGLEALERPEPRGLIHISTAAADDADAAADELEAESFRCVRCIREARRIWEATTSFSMTDLLSPPPTQPRLARWAETQAAIPARLETVFEYDHKLPTWVANDVLGGLVVDGGLASHHLCEACLHCLPPPNRFAGNQDALLNYKDLLQAQRQLLRERRAAVEARRKALTQRGDGDAAAARA